MTRIHYEIVIPGYGLCEAQEITVNFILCAYKHTKIND